nr:immunoglobulin heavy chain junction region [Macaca mulatta]MOX60926.1 immunoglobulin heavy chain junction region [Macaca mulatta]MOX68201.1 immunoglobulin heavy chain junction region [Macaca mulatta]
CARWEAADFDFW